MPRYEQYITPASGDVKTVIATCYAAFSNLGWDIKYAAENRLFAYTPKTVFSNSMEVAVVYENSNLLVSSEMISGESFDLAKKNKKNVDKFFAEFEAVQQKITPAQIESLQTTIDALLVQTRIVAEEEVKELAELQEAMNLGGNLTVTYAIIAVNALVFILMAFNGAGIFDANGLVHIKWGSNFGLLTKSGDWWRLFTCMFLHFGIIHIALNMYALYSIAMYLEPMLGKAKFLVAYVCTGVLASVLSLWWHSEPVNSAGASGAVFGMYGVFLGLLTTNLIPKKVRQSLLQSIVIFVIYNLAYGLKGGIDNAAHVGGLLSGLAIGYAYAYSIKREKENSRTNWLLPAVIIISIAISSVYLQANKVSASEREIILNELKDTGYKDNDKFNELYNRFVELQKKALQVYDDYQNNQAELPKALQETAMPKWNEAETIASSMKQLDVSDHMHKKADGVSAYIRLRKQEIEIRSAIVANYSDSLATQLKQVTSQITEIVEKLK